MTKGELEEMLLQILDRELVISISRDRLTWVVEIKWDERKGSIILDELSDFRDRLKNVYAKECDINLIPPSIILTVFT